MQNRPHENRVYVRNYSFERKTTHFLSHCITVRYKRNKESRWQKNIPIGHYRPMGMFSISLQSEYNNLDRARYGQKKIRREFIHPS